MKSQIVNSIIYLVFLSSMTFSCSSRTKSSEIEPKDTLYLGKYEYWKKENEQKKNIIRISDTTEIQTVNFLVDDSIYFKVSYARFEKYPLFLTDLKSADLIYADSTKGIFCIVPKDTVFSFYIWQNYGIDNVIAKTKRIEADSIYYDIRPKNGKYKIMEMQLNATKK